MLFSGELDFITRALADLSIPPGKGSVPVSVGINSFTYRPGYVYGTTVGFTFVGSYLDWILQHAVVSTIAGQLAMPVEGVSFRQLRRDPGAAAFAGSGSRSRPA